MRLLNILGRLLLVCTSALGLTLFGGPLLPHSGDIAFTVYSGIDADIYRLDIDQQIRVNLTRRAGYDLNPSWSPDGRWLAFTSDRGGPLSVYVMDARGRDIRPVVPLDVGAAFSPRWAPDGERLYFFRLVGGTQEIYVVNRDGSGFEAITESSQRDAIRRDLDIDPNNINGSFSPDGQRSVFMAYRDERWGIFISEPQSRTVMRIADAGQQYSEPPIWSHDGQTVAFIALTAEGFDVFLSAARPGEPVRRLTTDRAVESHLSWRPF